MPESRSALGPEAWPYMGVEYSASTPIREVPGSNDVGDTTGDIEQSCSRDGRGATFASRDGYIRYLRLGMNDNICMALSTRNKGEAFSDDY